MYASPTTKLIVGIFGIVIEVDKTAITGTGEYFAVYASTHEKG